MGEATELHRDSWGFLDTLLRVNNICDHENYCFKARILEVK